jgi:hypothetical protein
LKNHPQQTCNLCQLQKTKSKALRNPLVVVVYRGFSATTTIEKTKTAKKPLKQKIRKVDLENC